MYMWPYPGDISFEVGQLIRFPDGRNLFPYRYKAFRDISVKFGKTHGILYCHGVIYLHEIQGNIALVIEERDPLTYIEKTHTKYYVRILSSVGAIWM